MCLIIVTNRYCEKIPNEVIECAAVNNPDGFGIGYFTHGYVRVYKGLFKLEKIIGLYNRALEEADGEIILHFRLATHGEINAEDCHPFIIKNNGILMAHNGIIHNESFDISQSDSAQFANKVLSKLPNCFVYFPAIIKLLEESIGYYNKVALLNEYNYLVLLNKQEWTKCKGSYYSNDSGFPQGCDEYFNSELALGDIDNYDYLDPNNGYMY